MDEIILETSSSPEVTVKSYGKLYIKGWERQEVRARASGKDNLNTQQEGDAITISCHSNCDLRLPIGAQLQVQTAHGETIIKSVTGKINVQQANAGLTLHDIGSAAAEFVERDLNARNVEGNLNIKQIGRFANVRGVNGDFSAEFIGAHLNLTAVAGEVHASAKGNVTCSLDPKAGQSHQLEAHGVMTCRLPQEADTALNITGYGPITVKLGDIAESTHDNSLNLTLGAGSATVDLTSYGPVSVLEASTEAAEALEFDFELGPEFGDELKNLSSEIQDQVNEQLASQMEMLGHQIEAQMSNISTIIDSAGLSKEQAERVRLRTEKKVAQAQEKIRRAQERATRKIEKARRRAERQARKSAARAKRRPEFHFAVSQSDSPEAPAEPVSDEERMMILNMLSEKKISIEEAETLLAALEGRS